MSNSLSYAVVTRFGTPASYRWEASEPMSRESADALVRERESQGLLAKRWTAAAVECVGLPEGWAYGKTDAECVRERLAEIDTYRTVATRDPSFDATEYEKEEAALDQEEAELEAFLAEQQAARS